MSEQVVSCGKPSETYLSVTRFKSALEHPLIWWDL